MAGKNVYVVLIPRFTAFVGPTPCLSAPMSVSAYSSIVFDFWNGTMNGAPAAGVQLDLFESNDAVTWEACAGGSPWVRGPGVGEFQATAVFTKAWMRFGVTPMGNQPAVTCFAAGYFQLREHGGGR